MARGARIVTSCSPRSCLGSCALTGPRPSRVIGCFRVELLIVQSPPSDCRSLVARHGVRPDWTSRLPCTPCATASPPICSKPAPTSAPSRSCSATPSWQAPLFMRTLPPPSSLPPPARSIGCKRCRQAEPAGGRPALEVADIFRHHGAAYRAAHAGHLSPGQRRVMAAIEACRTPALGGHVEQCTDCGQIRIAYNSCRNRHCPKCQGLAAAQWLADRQTELLPVPYFHLVFTLPAPIAEIA